jgi:hypothetical protein
VTPDVDFFVAGNTRDNALAGCQGQQKFPCSQTCVNGTTPQPVRPPSFPLQVLPWRLVGRRDQRVRCEFSGRFRP